MSTNGSSTTARVRRHLVVPQGARWIVERHAESAEVLEDEESVMLRANVLPPVQQRVGLGCSIAGPDAFVTEPADVRDAGRDLACELLAHHLQI